MSLLPNCKASLLRRFRRPSIYPNDVVALCTRRARKLGAETSTEQVRALLQLGRQWKPEVAFAVITSLANVWLTSSQLQEVASCRFGCADEPDAMKHYLRCEALWRPLGDISPPYASETLERLCLVPLARIAKQAQHAARRLAAARHALHTMRLEQPLNPDDLSNRQVILAAAHKFEICRGERFAL